MDYSVTPLLQLELWGWLKFVSCSMIMLRHMVSFGFFSTYHHMYVTSESEMCCADVIATCSWRVCVQTEYFAGANKQDTLRVCNRWRNAQCPRVRPFKWSAWSILINSLGIDHVTYALFDFSLSFLIYLIITFLVHLYQSTGIKAASKNPTEEEGYTKLDRDGPAVDAEAYELTEHDLGDSDVDEDAVKVGGDEDDWADPGRREMKGVRLWCYDYVMNCM